MAMPKLTDLCPALLVIDSQCEFVTTGESTGPIATEDPTDALAMVCALIDAAHELDLPVIFTQEAHRKERVDFGGNSTATRELTASRERLGSTFVRRHNHATATLLFENVVTAASSPQILICFCEGSGWTRC